MLLVRHTETDHAARTLCYGWRDVALSSDGAAAIEALTAQLALHRPRLIISSDLMRCRVMAEAIAEKSGATLKLDPRWRERHFGAWEGRAWGDIHAEDAGAIARLVEPDFAPPGGENLITLAERIGAALSDAAFQNDTDPIIIVAHGGSIAVAQCVLRGAPLCAAADFIPRLGAIVALHTEQNPR